MGAALGNRNNPFGRPKGSRNEIAADFRKAYQEAKPVDIRTLTFA
jgi:hypothetical protein